MGVTPPPRLETARLDPSGPESLRPTMDPQQNGHYGSVGGVGGGGPAVNGEMPSVPITTLSGIASLTDLLPELPVPGPAPHGNPNPGSKLLYHGSLVEEANQLLSHANPALVEQLERVLSRTSVDYIELSDPHALPVALPANRLVASLCQTNPGVFGAIPNATPGVGSLAPGWAASPAGTGANFHNRFHGDATAFPLGSNFPTQSSSASNNGAQLNNFEGVNQTFPATSGYEDESKFLPGSQFPAGMESDSGSGTVPVFPHTANNVVTNNTSGSEVLPNLDNGTQIKTEVKPVIVPIMKDESKSNLNSVKQPMIKLNMLNAEAAELMAKSVKDYNKLNSDQVKMEEQGVYDSFTPRSQRSKHAKVVDMGSSDSEEDESIETGDKKPKNKFFKATEKERDDEKKRLREFRKRKVVDDDFQPSGGEEQFGKRRRKEATPPPASPESFVPKKVTRTLERKLIPIIPKINADDLMEDSNTFLRFNKTVELIFDNMEDVNMKDLEALDDDADIPQEILIPKYQLADLAAETAKLKSLGVMESVSHDRLVKLLNILELNIRDGARVTPIGGYDDDEDNDDRLYMELAMERVMRAADASLAVMHILTSKKMSKRVYIDDVIDRVALFLRYQLANTIYPSYDPVYKEISKSKTGYVGSMKKKRTYATNVKDKSILALYNKTHELTSMLAELIRMQLLTDTTILHISTMGVAPFFVESIPELQLAALKLVTNLFSRYEKHRKLLLDDILASIARLPSSKRSLRSYRLGPTTYIQMLTALVLQLIQCVVCLPRKLALKNANELKNKAKDEDIMESDAQPVVDRDVLINNKYEMAMATAHQFLTVFLKKCGSKNEDIDYRPLFENFVQDLLTTVNVPEWPAAELLLSLLGRVLREKFKDRSTEMALRISSLEYLGVVAARLRRDAIQSKMKVDYIDSIIEIIKSEDAPEPSASDSPQKSKKGKNKKTKADKPQVESEEVEDERSSFLQRVLLDYLVVSGGEEDQSVMNARHFYICQWYRDMNAVGRKPKRRPQKSQASSKKKKGSDSSEEESDQSEEEEEEQMSDSKKNELFRLREVKKDAILSKILPFGTSKSNKAQVLTTHIDAASAHLIVKYLSSKRPFFNSFNYYLKDILHVLTEQSTQIRTKALKCMTMVVSEDPDVLLRKDMQKGVQFSFTDSSTMVREAAVDLVGKFILHKQDLITQYYTIITDRILDTGVSVRKRVIKILKDICLEFPGYEKIPEICVKIIRRINDEEGIRKLVMEVFSNMWFVPLRERGRSQEDNELLVTRAQNITDVVVACRDTGLEWFEQLLETLFQPREDKDDSTKKATEPPPQLVMACQQIVDCLVESVLRIEESNLSSGEGPRAKSLGSSNRIVACLTTLYLFAKIRPQLLVEHVQTLQPYLQVQCQTQGDYQIISNVARTLELSVPLIKHPSEIFLSQLEEDAVKLILQHDKKVVSACLSCLGSIVNNVTKNFGLIRDCFVKYFSFMTKYRKHHEINPDDPRCKEQRTLAWFRRAMFTVSQLLRHFDFTDDALYTGLVCGNETVEDVFETIFHFITHDSKEIQSDTLHALGLICVRHYNFMLETKLKQLYIDILQEDFYSEYQKVKVLNNLELYLAEEEVRMRKLDENWKNYGDKENLKEMGDVNSGMASTVIQVYLNAVLNSFVHPSVLVRQAALKVISLILAQGLVHPVQIVPYLICMSTDSEQKISHTADREMQEINKKYPGFIHMKLLQGIRLSHQLQEIVQGRQAAVRGHRVVREGELPTALNGFLYSILKSTKAQRRGVLTSLLKQFDDSSKSSLSLMLYLADNLAYIPYTVLDEPLFVIHNIDIMVSVSGSNLLQSFKEALQPPPSAEARHNLETGKTDYIYDEDLDDDFESVLSRLPEDCTVLQHAIRGSQGCMLLLVLKDHLKDFYGLTTGKIQQYSPNDTSKAFDRQVTRRANVRFNPKATIEILRQGSQASVPDIEGRKELVRKYLEFKELMTKIDPDDEDDEDEDGNRNSESSPQKKSTSIMPGYNPSPAKQHSQVNNHQGSQKHHYPDPSQAHPSNYPVPTLQQQQQLQRQLQHQQRRHERAAASASTMFPPMAPPGVMGEEMVLDPSTGMMVPQSQMGGDAAYPDGQSGVDYKDSSTQKVKVPRIKINLGSSGNSHHNRHKSSSSSSSSHHRDRSSMGSSNRPKKKKKKTKRISDEDDDSSLEDSDPDFKA